MLLLIAVGVLLCTPLHIGQFVDEEERQDWVDPSDMLSFDSTTGTMRTKKVVVEPIHSSVPSEEEHAEDTQNADQKTADAATCKDLDKCKADVKQLKKGLTSCQKQLDVIPPSESAYLKQFVRVLVERLPDAHSQLQHRDTVAYSATLVLSQADLDLFNDLIYTEQGDLRDSHSALVNMIREVHLLGNYRPDTWYTWLGDLFVVHLTTILQMTAVFALATVGVLATAHIRVSWFSFFMKLLLLLFLISIPWNWWHLYKIELAQRQAKAIQDMPAECNPGDQSIWGLLTNAFSVNVDKCAKYHEQMMVDPIWEVAPTRAIAVTLTKFCVEPLEHIGRSLGKFIRAPLEDLPVQMWPIVLIFLVVVFTLALIMGFGYKIRLFYLFGIEPDSNRNQVQGVEDLQKGIEALTTKVEMLTQETQKAADTEKIVERIQAITAAPHWEGRGERYPPPRYMIDHGVYPRGVDVVDSRVGATGEGHVPMPGPQYPLSQHPVDLYPPVSNAPTTTSLPYPPANVPIPAQANTPMLQKLGQFVGRLFPGEAKKESTDQTPRKAMPEPGNSSASSTKPQSDAMLQAFRAPVAVETVTAEDVCGSSGTEKTKAKSSDEDLGGVWPDKAVNGQCNGEYPGESLGTSSGDTYGGAHGEMNGDDDMGDTSSENGGNESDVKDKEGLDVKVADQKKGVSLKPEVENIGSEC